MQSLRQPRHDMQMTGYLPIRSPTAYSLNLEPWKPLYFHRTQIQSTAHLKNFPDQLWAAEKWINYTISDEAQLRYMRSLGASPTNANVAKIATAKEVKVFHIGNKKHFDDLWFWPILSSETQFAYGNMWREVFQ